MARAFSSALHTLRNTAITTPGSVGTIACWFNPTWSSGDSAIHVLWQYGDNTVVSNEFPSFQKFLDNNVYIGFSRVGDDDRIVVADTGLFAAGTWAHHCFTWTDAGDDEKYYVNNVEKGSRTSALVTASASALTLGNYDASTGGAQNLAGSLAEWAMWSVVLDAGDRGALTAGVSPLLVATANLEQYYPLLSRTSPEPSLMSQEGLTVASAAVADHPRMFYGARPFIQKYTTAVAAGSIVPILLRQYRQRWS